MKERRKVMVGRVISDKMSKTVIVQVEERRSHPVYGKVVSQTRRFKAHNEDPLAKLGDIVKITEARPMSHEKRFRVSEIVQRGVVVEEIAEKELDSLRAKEEAERAARRVEEERRAAVRLAQLAGEDEEPAGESEETAAGSADAGPSDETGGGEAQ